MGKKRRSTEQLSVAEVAFIIKDDLLKGVDKRTISNQKKIPMGRVMESINWLRKNDKEVQDSLLKPALLAIKSTQEKLDKVSVKKKEKKPEPAKKMPRITDSEKLDIAEKYESGGISMEQLAKDYKHSYSSISKICNDILGADKVKEISKANQSEHYGNSREKFDNIIKDYETCQFTMVELADKYNVSLPRISSICRTKLTKKKVKEIARRREENVKKEKEEKDIKINISANKNKVEPKKEEVKQDQPNVVVTTTKSYGIHTIAPEIKEVTGEFIPAAMKEDIIAVNGELDYIECGLINHRHNMYVQNFIFDNIADNEIFDFTKLERQVEDFIKRNIKFKLKMVDGKKIPVATKRLVVRASGLQTASMALVKVCYKLQINLIVSHWQILKDTTGEYRQQVIFNDFPMVDPTPHIVSHIATGLDGLYLYKSDVDSYMDIDSFYELKVIEKPSGCRDGNNTNTRALRKSSILSPSLNDIMMANAILAKEYISDLHNKPFHEVTINQYMIDDKSSLGYNNIALQRAYY